MRSAALAPVPAVTSPLPPTARPRVPSGSPPQGPLSAPPRPRPRRTPETPPRGFQPSMRPAPRTGVRGNLTGPGLIWPLGPRSPGCPAALDLLAQVPRLPQAPSGTHGTLLALGGPCLCGMSHPPVRAPQTGRSRDEAHGCRCAAATRRGSAGKDASDRGQAWLGRDSGAGGLRGPRSISARRRAGPLRQKPRLAYWRRGVQGLAKPSPGRPGTPSAPARFSRCLRLPLAPPASPLAASPLPAGSPGSRPPPRPVRLAPRGWVPGKSASIQDPRVPATCQRAETGKVSADRGSEIGAGPHPFENQRLLQQSQSP
uniref:nascent polypeptide-associated complex subunit alpha, muscle-specific form-like n=1 Tax=Nyctereutes procyonoides TaxID=34880 RepID=UPI002443830E|nr:nascent polypeptide-associated complex subunit alpha, muscle-specific form-like [Nyctereutes procyonoides]